MQYEVEGNDFAPWKLPSAHSYQLHQKGGLQRASPIDIISDDKGVIYSDGTRIELVQNCFSLEMQAEKDSLLVTRD